MSHSSSRGGKGPYTKRQNQNAPSEVDNNSRDVEKKVKQIAEMFGDWKKTDIQRCLEENSFDVNLVVQKKVDGKEDWTTVEKKEIRTQKPQRGRGGRGGARGGGRGGSRGGSNSPSTGTRSGSTSTTQQPEASTNDKPIKKKPTKQDKNTSSEVRNFSVPENEPVEETKPQTQQQQPKVLSYSEAVAAFKKKEDEEKKKLEDEKNKIEQQAKEQKDQQVKSERNQRKKKGDKNKAPKEEVKETVVPEPVQQPQPVVEESVVEEEVPEEEFANEEEEVEQEEEEEQVEEIQQQPAQPIQQQQQQPQVAQHTYQNSFEQQRQQQQQQQQQQEEQPQLQMPSGLYNQAVSLQFGTLEIGSQPKTQSQNSVNQPNAQTNPQMQNGQYWNDPKMHNFIPYIPNQYPYHPQYYPYIYQYYQPNGAQGVNANKNYNQAYYQQEGFAGMYNQVSGTEETEQAHQDPYQQYQMQQPYFLMYPQQQQQQQQQMETKHKSESPQNDPKVNPYPTYLPGYQNQYPQSYVFGHPNQMMYPHYPTSGNNTGNPSSTTSQPTTKKW